MTFKISSAVDKVVGETAVRLVKENPKRTVLNIHAGDHDLWYGDENVRAGVVGNRIKAGNRAAIEVKSEVWVIRSSGEEAACGYSQEVDTNG